MIFSWSRGHNYQHGKYINSSEIYIFFGHDKIEATHLDNDGGKYYHTMEYEEDIPSLGIEL